MRKSLYLFLFICTICRGTNAFDLEYLQQRLLQQPPPNRFAGYEQHDQEYMQLLRQLDTEQLAAEQQRWKEEMQNYYAAKASQSILSHAEFRDYFDHKWFNPINDLIEKISEDAVAHGGHHNRTLVRQLHEMLANPELSKDINRFGVLNAQIDEYKAKMARMPEWQQRSLQNPDLMQYMDYNSNTGQYSLKKDYDPYSDDADAAAKAKRYWSGLGNVHTAYTIDELRKLFDKAKPREDTYGVSGKKAMATAAGVISGLTDQQRYDAGQEILYGSDKQAFADLHSREYAELEARFGQYSHTNLVDTMNGKKASEATKKEIRRYLEIRDKANSVINRGLQNLELDYAQRWVSSRDPGYTERMREKFIEKMAGKAVSPVVTTKVSNNRRQVRRLAHGAKR